MKVWRGLGGGGGTKCVQSEPRAAGQQLKMYDGDELPKDCDFLPSIPVGKIWKSMKSA